MCKTLIDLISFYLILQQIPQMIRAPYLFFTNAENWIAVLNLIGLMRNTIFEDTEDI